MSARTKYTKKVIRIKEKPISYAVQHIFFFFFGFRFLESVNRVFVKKKTVGQANLVSVSKTLRAKPGLEFEKPSMNVRVHFLLGVFSFCLITIATDIAHLLLLCTVSTGRMKKKKKTENGPWVEYQRRAQQYTLMT